MRNPVYGSLPALALSLALCSCTSIDRQPQSLHGDMDLLREPALKSCGARYPHVLPVHSGACAFGSFNVGSRTAISDAMDSGNNSAANDVQPADAGAPVGANTERPRRDAAGNKHLTVNLHIFGLSYHPDREGTRISHLDNEYNFGLGLEYGLHDGALGVVISEAGFFKDSGRTWARFAGMGYLFKLSDNWKLGADLLVIQSPTYNKGTVFAAPIPHLSRNFGPVIVNVIYIPGYRKLNRFSVYGLYFTIPLLK